MPYSGYDIPPIMVLDGFMTDAEEIRAKALDAGFKDLPYQDRIYRGSGVDYQPRHVLPRIASCFAQPIIPELSVFRLADAKEVPEAAVHSDNITAQMAAMLYLTPNDNCRGGTAFWRHKETGWYGMPSVEEFADSGYTREDIITAWKNPDAWELVELVALRFNRFVCYPSARWHSRYPLRGWGSEEAPETARLTYNLFFNFPDPRMVYPKA